MPFKRQVRFGARRRPRDTSPTFGSTAAQTCPVSARHLIHCRYLIEIDARDQGIALTDEHVKLRRERAPALLEALRDHLERNTREFPPKSDLASAATYTLKRWNELARFVDDVRLPINNNAAKHDLRYLALGRKNTLFISHNDGGEDLTILHSLVTNCVQNGVNPEEYLADVLIRMRAWPNACSDELLPDRWKPVEGA
jgi:transposase